MICSDLERLFHEISNKNMKSQRFAVTIKQRSRHCLFTQTQFLLTHTTSIKTKQTFQQGVQINPVQMFRPPLSNYFMFHINTKIKIFFFLFNKVEI